jgi:predicted nucleic acid-binding protein
VNILLDTCAISELRKPEPSPAFLDWFNSCNERLLHLSTITLGELRFGIDRLSDGRRKNDLLTWYAELCLSYRGHIIAPSQAVCELWGTLRAKRRETGQPLAMADGLIGATAVHASMALVTRNTKDFQDLGVELINPWLPLR